MKIAVSTTIYPAAEPFLRDWYASLLAQSDQNYELWIGLDDIEPEDVQRIVGCRFPANWVASTPGDTPSRVRERVIKQTFGRCDGIVFVDCDDVLHPSRIAGALAMLESNELAGCALRLVDNYRNELGLTLNLPAGSSPEELLPRHNIFGLSNSAYRTELLRNCLPIPGKVVLVDWFLATKAWLMNAKIGFDPVVRMDYRQHGRSMAHVRFPVEPDQVIQDTELVREHFRFVLGSRPQNALTERMEKLKRIALDVELFCERIVQRREELQSYVEALNLLNPTPLWWLTVAHPALASMWQAASQRTYAPC
jgi:hypothetical protein